jgi:hypothetical protein
MIEFGGGSLELNGQPAKAGVTHAIKFASTESGQEMLVKVNDKAPWMGDVHVEGRRYVEVSIEMFMAMMARAGWLPVSPTAPVEEVDGDDDEKRA